MKYKVGDKVRVRSGLKSNQRYDGVYFTDEMKALEGEVFEIIKVTNIFYNMHGSPYNFTDSMLEPVEEMSAEEVFEIFGIICKAHPGCIHCPIGNLGRDTACMTIVGENFEDVIKIACQWKANHEKKPIETEFVWMVRIIEQSGDIKRCVHEEPIENSNGYTVNLDEKQSDILKKYCSEHEGNFFAVREWICKAKEE